MKRRYLYIDIVGVMCVWWLWRGNWGVSGWGGNWGGGWGDEEVCGGSYIGGDIK